jgi:hypothetical protein
LESVSPMYVSCASSICIYKRLIPERNTLQCSCKIYKPWNSPQFRKLRPS